MTTDLHILQLESYDDVVSVRDRLAFAEARYVILVWPREAVILRRKLDLVLIQRQAARLGIWIALVASDPEVDEHARALNISVFRSVAAARRGRWKRPRAQVATDYRPDPAAQAELVEHITHQREQILSPALRRWRQAGRWLLFAGLLLALVLGCWLIGPSATVIVTPASDQVFIRVPIVADPSLADIDIENFRMPASVVTLEATSHVTIESSGHETAGASPSQGLVTFANTSDQPILIPLGTIVLTSGVYPIRYETLIETTLPAGETSSVQVPIRALPEYSGANGNVNPGAINRIEGDLAYVLTVTNPNATYGGAVQERATVTEEDHQRLLVLGRQQVLQHARDLLLLQLTGDQFLVPGSVTIIEERPEWTLYSAFVGDAADSVSLDLRARTQAVVVDERLARQVAYAGLAPYIQPGLEVAPDDLTFTRGDIQQIDPNGQVTFLMAVEGNIAVSIDASQVRDRVAGVSVNEAQRRLQREFTLDLDRPPQITIWPRWWEYLPVLPVRITVRVETP